MSTFFTQHNSILSYICQADKSHVITYQNEAFRDSFVHIQPRSFLDLIRIEAEIDNALDVFKLAEDQQPYPVLLNTKIHDQSGEYQLWVFEIFRLPSGYHIAGQPVLDAVTFDSIELEQTRKTLEKLHWNLSHRFRQPLTEIGGLVQLMATIDPNTDPTEYGKLAQMLVAPYEKINAVLQDLLRNNPK